MNAAQQKRLHELSLIMLRDAHGEDFTEEQAAELPAQFEEYQRLSEAQNILSLLDEVISLRKIISECADACDAVVSPECTLAFMQQLPGEIAAVMSRLRRDKAQFDTHIQSNSIQLAEVLGRYLRDLRLRTFPDNDEGDYSLRWTSGEIQRVERLVAAVREGVAHG